MTTAPAASVCCPSSASPSFASFAPSGRVLVALPPTLWSLFTAIVLAIGFSCLAAVITVLRWVVTCWLRNGWPAILSRLL